MNILLYKVERNFEVSEIFSWIVVDSEGEKKTFRPG